MAYLKAITTPLTTLGSVSLGALREMGAMSTFLFIALRKIFFRKQLHKVFIQIRLIGADSLFLILIISTFTGMVLGLQSYFVLRSLGSDGVLGTLVSLSLVRELGPVLSAIMITGRAGSAIAAEIGVMRISEQLDALEVMDIDPMNFLIAPRLAACLIIFPLMTAIFDIVGILGGFIAGTVIMDSNSGIYFFRVQSHVGMDDVMMSLIKSIAFALIVGTISCYKGFFAHLRKDGAGPAAVNNATTSAVVLSCILILMFDYVITSLMK